VTVEVEVGRTKVKRMSERVRLLGSSLTLSSYRFPSNHRRSALIISGCGVGHGG
jgi:hypothetical protein